MAQDSGPEGSLHRTGQPVDVYIATCILWIIALLQVITGGLLITGIGRLGTDPTRRVLFGVIVLSRELPWALYLLCGGAVTALCGWGIITRKKFGWWLTLIWSMHHVVDALFLFPQDEFNASMGLIVDVALIIWLWLRRPLYHIGPPARWRRDVRQTSD